MGVALLVGALLHRAERVPRAVALRRGLGLGAIHGATAGGLVLWWLWASIGPGAWAALTVVLGAWGAVAGVSVVLVSTVRGRAVWAAAVITAVELARSSWPLGGLPWARSAQAALDAPWQGLLAWVGVTGTSFFTALVGCAVATAVCSRSSRVGGVGLVVAVGAAAVASSAWPPVVAEEGGPVARVGVVQGGVPGDGTDLAAHHREVTDRLVAESGRLAEGLRSAGRPAPDLLVWPESATAVDVLRDPRASRAARAAAADIGAPLVLGSILSGSRTDTLRNSSVVVDDRGAREGYVKQNLVPFGEYVPLRSLVGWLLPAVTREIRRDMLPGDSREAVRVGGWRVATALCFDVAHVDPLSSQVRGGADLIAVQTSNAAFYGTTQPEQQWAVTRMRAIELGRSVVVASTNGVSGAIGPNGEVMTRFAAGGAQSAVVALPVVSALTPAVLLGRRADWAIVLIAGLGLGLSFCGRAARR